ncbi:putative archaeal preflagellin peptidase FlaK [Candidatus Nitrososphaera gargensis Ga9.2]|uniref:Putative archaeal preflagellin peptidase FlaK n=1 Tax=Nitrososphaera gargensis (strain Ga9.2) TaxID=1237085 RepID=K0II21_NITGG|nr:putative archaeal preflagellin peptidase FlaK [Candidatus Nitrososphaera gargensis Ga9.2]
MLSILFIREILCFAMLSIGAYYDLKTREVDDGLWMVFGGAGSVLYAWEYVSGAMADAQIILVFISLTAVIALALYRYGFFGGADAKALVTISVILPVYYPLIPFYMHPITGITVLTNAVLFAMVVPLYNALSNLVKVARGERIFECLEEEPTWRKVLACFVGTPSNRPIRHHLVIEYSAGEGKKKKFSFRLNYGDDEGYGSSGNRSCYARSSTDSKRWLSQNLPFLLFMLAGFLATMLFGDVLLQVLLN